MQGYSTPMAGRRLSKSSALTSFSAMGQCSVPLGITKTSLTGPTLSCVHSCTLDHPVHHVPGPAERNPHQVELLRSDIAEAAQLLGAHPSHLVRAFPRPTASPPTATPRGAEWTVPDDCCLMAGRLLRRQLRRVSTISRTSPGISGGSSEQHQERSPPDAPTQEERLRPTVKRHVVAIRIRESEGAAGCSLPFMAPSAFLPDPWRADRHVCGLPRG
ncbi:hypothetical protein QF015_001579 [Paenarthrobacter sp. TE4293]